jgi:hypothetical protein
LATLLIHMKLRLLNLEEIFVFSRSAPPSRDVVATYVDRMWNGEPFIGGFELGRLKKNGWRL